MTVRFKKSCSLKAVFKFCTFVIIYCKNLRFQHSSYAKTTSWLCRYRNVNNCGKYVIFKNIINIMIWTKATFQRIHNYSFKNIDNK